MSDIQYERIVEVACYAGIIMLKSGGEIYRVEQTMSHIAKAHGVTDCESYATPTTIMLTIHDHAGRPYTTMKRIKERSVNLAKVELINDISRHLKPGDKNIEATFTALQTVDEEPSRNLLTMTLASAVAAASFAVVFGGGIPEFFCGFACGALLRVCVHNLNRLKLSPFSVNMAGGAIAALSGWILHALGFASDFRIYTLSTMMLLVPGMLVTNAFRDVVSGDLVSGVSRGIEAVCIAGALAAGASLVYTVLLYVGGVKLW